MKPSSDSAAANDMHPTDTRAPRLRARVSAGAIAAFLAALSGCSSPSELVEKKPAFKLASDADLPILHARVGELRKALRIQKNNPEIALATYISTARATAAVLDSAPHNAAARREYNFAVGRIIDTIDATPRLAPWFGPVSIPAEGDGFTLTHRHDSRERWNPALYSLTPSDQYDVGGEYFSKRTVREGIGAPVVVVTKEINRDARERFAPPRAYYGVTAVARFDGNTCEIAIEDPLASETTRFGGETVPLAADFSVPLAALLEDDSNNPKKQGLSRYFHPSDYDETARIVRLEPYDPDKTVVLVIHGLGSSQATWTPLINTLRGDPEIRRNFQFWFFSYPTGYPYPYSAMLLRRELDRVPSVFPRRKPMVVVGHSMGGCISRLLLTDTGEQLWKKIFKQSPEETQLSGPTKDILREALIFDRRDEVGRVVFMSAPLKGSEIASKFLGRLGAKLVRMPARFQQIGREAIATDDFDFDADELQLDEFPSSVDTLAPNNRFVRAINTIPVTRNVPHHVVVGDRGKGDSPDSSDGIVPYWSSHMETASSEKIVPSSHASHAHPEGIEEVRRILKLHLRNSGH